MIISKIAEYLEIESVSYQLAIRNNKKYIISENFIDDGTNFKDGYDIISEYKKKHEIGNVGSINEECFNNLEDLSILLKETFKEDSSMMMKN